MGIASKMEYQEQFLFNKGLKIQFTHVATGNSVSFKAYITELKDSLNTDWEPDKVFGRVDPIQIFKQTSRTISLGWDVPSYDETEATQNQLDAEKLMRMFYPTYKDLGVLRASSISSSPLIMVKFLNLISDPSFKFPGLLAAIDGISYEPLVGNDGPGMFVISNKEKSAIAIRPKVTKFSCKMRILHTFPMAWDANMLTFKLKNYPYEISTGEVDKKNDSSGPKTAQEKKADVKKEAEQNTTIGPQITQNQLSEGDFWALKRLEEQRTSGFSNQSIPLLNVNKSRADGILEPSR